MSNITENIDPGLIENSAMLEVAANGIFVTIGDDEDKVDLMSLVRLELLSSIVFKQRKGTASAVPKVYIKKRGLTCS